MCLRLRPLHSSTPPEAPPLLYSSSISRSARRITLPNFGNAQNSLESLVKRVLGSRLRIRPQQSAPPKVPRCHILPASPVQLVAATPCLLTGAARWPQLSLHWSGGVVMLVFLLLSSLYKPNRSLTDRQFRHSTSPSLSADPLSLLITCRGNVFTYSLRSGVWGWSGGG